MKPHELKVTKRRSPKRLGRGIGSGRGKTAGRGTKGQRARSGANLRPTFEGGQNPLIHRIPKLRGFVSRRPKYQIVNTDDLNRFGSEQPITPALLVEAGLIVDVNRPVKLLMRGPLTKKLTIQVQAASRNAQRAVEARGGTVNGLTEGGL